MGRDNTSQDDLVDFAEGGDGEWSSFGGGQGQLEGGLGRSIVDDGTSITPSSSTNSIAGGNTLSITFKSDKNIKISGKAVE